MKLIVGLGNIGKEYADTNHNVGFMVIDRVSEMLGESIKKNGCDADYAEFNKNGEKVILAKPRTYMNESGRSVKSFMKKFGFEIEDVVVINDDIDLAPGYVRIRKSGSAGTHNGLRSIIKETGSGDFKRIRVGIGLKNPNQDLASFVLAKMRMTDEQKQGLEKAAKAVYDYILGDTIDNVMSKYNGDSDSNGKH
ncbi:MAG: aminoacyl-tRNA hydrolase [Clostridia bacterium]|nr:aminoacyl-tRNA hydrolase [Clostridia bacterium]